MSSKSIAAAEVSLRLVLVSLVPLFFFLWLNMPIWLYGLVCFCLNTSILMTIDEEKKAKIFGEHFAQFRGFWQVVVITFLGVIFTFGMVGLTLLNFRAS